MSAAASIHAHTGTPTLQVSDARGLPVRTVQFHRRETGDPIDTRVTEQRFDAPGRLAGSRDPYLFDLARGDGSVPFNLSQIMSLSGVALMTCSVDAGWRIVLPGEAGQSVEHWDGCGSHSLTEYDELLRPVAVRESGHEVAEHTLERFTYGDAGAEFAARNLCGQRVRHDDPAGTVHVRALSINGNVLSHSRKFLTATDAPDWAVDDFVRDALLEPGAGATTAYTFAPSSELLSQTDAFGNVQAFAYTVDGQLKNTRLTLAGNGQTEKLLVSALHYTATGQIEAETAGNGVITRHHYDEATGRLTELSAHKVDGTPLQTLKYCYDAVGNVLSIEDAAQPIRYFNNQRIRPIKTYRYDTLYQLIHATGCEAKTGSGGPALPDLQPLPSDPGQLANYTQTFYYDAGGNLLDLVHVGPQAHGRTLTRARYSNRCLPERDNRPPTEDELVAGFDANGNLRELQVGQSLTWDLRNQLREVRPVVREDAEDDRERYIYDGGGQRVRKVHSGLTKARTVIREVRYLSGVEIRSHSGTGEILHVITVSAGSNSVQVLHWVAGQPQEIAQNQVRYSLGDHLKSSTLELDQNAGLISQEWYYPFGGTAYWAGRNATEAKYKTVRYSGKERDTTGLLYYGFRFYAPWLQRWLNPDPAGTAGGMNLFSMVANNPIVHFDERGNIPENFNPQQYLVTFKLQFETLYPDPLVTLNKDKARHYERKINSITSISSEKERQYFTRQLYKYGRVLLSQRSMLNSSEWSQQTRHHNAVFAEFILAAMVFDDLDFYDVKFEFQQGAPRFGAESNAGRFGGGTANQGYAGASSSRQSSGAQAPSGSNDQRQQSRPSSGQRPPPQPSSSGHAHSSRRTGNAGAGNGRSLAAPQFNVPVNAAYPPSLPQGAGARTIEGYNLAMHILNNETNERAVFPGGFNLREFRKISLLVHPDKLKLDGAPHVQRAANDAFQIISRWKDRAS
ncbi:RHS repeat domain-containing protein [Pseudomonas sp. O230]|uniref:RHS repeat domain-containing protein n=1 Tax=Pseudomonas sp. O230 TaxID=3159450 RepID=UPI00387B351C